MNSSKPRRFVPRLRRLVPRLRRLVATNNGPSQENIAYKTRRLMITIVLGLGTIVLGFGTILPVLG